MKDSLIRPPAAGHTVRGSKKKPLHSDNKAQRSPDDFHLPTSSPSQISSFTDDVLAAASTDSAIDAVGDLEEVGSSSPARSLILENTVNAVDLPVLPPDTPIDLPVADEEEISSIALTPFVAEVVEAEEVCTESSEAPILIETRIVAEQRKTEKRREKLESVIIGFSKSVEELEDAIKGGLLPALDRNRRDGKRSDALRMSLLRLTEVTLGCILGAFLLPVIIVATDLVGWLIWRPSEFNGPSPT